MISTKLINFLCSSLARCNIKENERKNCDTTSILVTTEFYERALRNFNFKFTEHAQKRFLSEKIANFSKFKSIFYL